ncbi:MAG: NAD-dependent epimerase/dehydratase family protein, partial [Candidatus Kryptoniota bacterium]
MIIVTGGAGFIGSAVVWRLNKMGRSDIIIVDHLGKTEKWRNLVPLKYADYFEKDDFLKLIQEKKLGSQVKLDAIVHMGACSATTELDASYLMRNNFEYSKVLAQFAIERNARFI